MSSIHSNIVNLAAKRGSPGRPARRRASRLQAIPAFGSNPGTLRAWSYVPHGLKGPAPLIVVLHGCTQSAAGYDEAAGWSELADELGFVLLFPEQQRFNNPNLCFNWFSPVDSRRDSGEALSIRQMIAWVSEAQEIDARRIFVTGLSAGGAMASTLLATYPEIFAGGAIIAGLPFGTAATVSEAFASMAGRGVSADTELAALVRDASTHDGPWPHVSVWQGSADTTVNPANADRIIAQWHLLHGVDSVCSEETTEGAHIRRIWRNGGAQPVLEQNIIIGMGHGTPLKTTGVDACGKPAAYMLDVGISSTRAIAKTWGLTGRSDRQVEAEATEFRPQPAIFPAIAKTVARRTSANHPARGVSGIIEDALRAVGLMK